MEDFIAGILIFAFFVTGAWMALQLSKDRPEIAAWIIGIKKKPVNPEENGNNG